MARFVKFPGTAGSYASTPSQNILDSNTAHLQQSIGQWDPGQSAALSQDVTPVFGSNTIKVTSTAAHWGTPSQVAPFSVLPDTEYTFSLSYLDVTGRAGGASDTARIYMQWFDAGDVSLGTTENTSDQPVLPAGQFVFMSNTATSPATAAKVKLTTKIVGDFSGRVFHVDAASLQLGSDGTFVPSLRIVGDLQLETKMSTNNLASYQSLISKQWTGGQNFGWILFLDVTDKLLFRPGDGVSAINLFSAEPTGLSVGQPATIKVTYTSADRVATFYVDDGLLSATTPGAAFVMAHTDTIATVGQDKAAGGSSLDGDMYFANVRDGIDGPIVAQFNAEDIPIP